MKKFFVASNNYVGLMNLHAHPRWRFWGSRPLCAKWPKWYHPANVIMDCGPTIDPDAYAPGNEIGWRTTNVRDETAAAALTVICPPGGHKQ